MDKRKPLINAGVIRREVVSAARKSSQSGILQIGADINSGPDCIALPITDY
jgi:hypothetical protein